MQKKVKTLAILGSTGSIGCQVLDIVRSFKDRFNVAGMAAGDNINHFTSQIAEFNPRFVTCNQNGSLQCKAKFLSMEDMASHPDVDMVIVATTGRAGLQPTLAALRAGKLTAIANKEILVMAGEIITALAAQHKASILPIDSEHSAVWQCLRGEDSGVKRLLLTASGGPFFGQTPDMLAGVTVAQALDHPTWKMGKKVTIDSATLFNKGMEAIEARWLFNIPYDKIEILVHRQSIIHSMVEFMDGSIKAQLSTPDMRLPIQYALFYPERVKNDSLSSINFADTRALTFEPVNYAQFPCLKLALEAARKGGTYPAVLCAADEIAVQLFLDKQIKFTEIANIIETTLNLHKPPTGAVLEEIISADAWARVTALKAARKGI
jgi:1-deoxy-D-xylulose-5-phosphate reductoisomerase